jgi:hypothetical protein
VPVLRPEESELRLQVQHPAPVRRRLGPHGRAYRLRLRGIWDQGTAWQQGSGGRMVSAVTLEAD